MKFVATKIVSIILIILLFGLCTEAIGSGKISIERERTSNNLADSYSLGFGVKNELTETLLVEGKYKQGKTNGKTTENSSYFKVNYDPPINNMYHGWLYNETGYDEATNVDFENIAGFGIKRYLIKTVYKEYTRKLSVSFGLLYDIKSTKDPDTQAIFNDEKSRYSLRIAYVDDKIVFVTFHKPSTEDKDDYINTLYVSFNIAKVYDLGYLQWYYNYEYESLSKYTTVNEGIKLEVKF